MKTEIDRISEIMKMLLAHEPIIDVPYEQLNDIAIALGQEGYGNVSEYKAKIEDLKDEIIYLERKIAIRDNALKDRDKAIEMLEDKQDTIVKQAKIDVLNELKGKMFEREYMGVKYKERIFYESEIDDMIAEVENDK